MTGKKMLEAINGRINAEPYSSSIQEKDHAGNNFLQWFVAEQVEVDSCASTVGDRLRLIGASGDGLLQLDKELSQRVFRPPCQAGAQ